MILYFVFKRWEAFTIMMMMDLFDRRSTSFAYFKFVCNCTVYILLLSHRSGGRKLIDLYVCSLVLKRLNQVSCHPIYVHLHMQFDHTPHLLVQLVYCHYRTNDQVYQCRQTFVSVPFLAYCTRH